MKKNSKQTLLKKVSYTWITYIIKAFFSAGWKYVQFGQYDDLEDRKDGIFFFKFERNINTSLLDKKTAKETTKPLQPCLNLPQYILSTYTKKWNL